MCRSCLELSRKLFFSIYWCRWSARNAISHILYLLDTLLRDYRRTYNPVSFLIYVRSSPRKVRVWIFFLCARTVINKMPCTRFDKLFCCLEKHQQQHKIYVTLFKFYFNICFCDSVFVKRIFVFSFIPRVWLRKNTSGNMATQFSFSVENYFVQFKTNFGKFLKLYMSHRIVTIFQYQFHFSLFEKINF